MELTPSGFHRPAYPLLQILSGRNLLEDLKINVDLDLIDHLRETGNAILRDGPKISYRNRHYRCGRIS